MRNEVIAQLEAFGIQPSAQRVAVAEYVLVTDQHPSADQVFSNVSENFPMISRATIYNTLNLFVEKGLLRELHISPGKVVFDPVTTKHHHFIDEETGAIKDIEWKQLKVSNLDKLTEFEVNDYQVILRGKIKQN